MVEIERADSSWLARLIGFAQLLRRRGMTVGTQQVISWIRAIDLVGWLDLETFYQIAQTTLLNREADRVNFRQAFLDYWGGRTDSIQSEASGRLESTAASPPIQAASHSEAVGAQPAHMDEVSGPQELSQAGLYSAREMLRRKDFATVTEQERQQIQEILKDFALNLATYKTRRYRAGDGDRLDLRASLRHNLRFGGEWLQWDKRKRKRQLRPVVVLADISGSMQAYSRMLLLFVHALWRGYRADVEAFLFGTQLTRITPAFRNQPQERFLDRISALASDWSGGTRIGKSLESFHLDWARRVLNRRPVVIIISDGWDRGDPALLARVMARLQRSSASLIWLNPWLGSASFEPRTRGMLASLPYIDHFLPAHNLASLQDLADLLGQLSTPNQGQRVAYPVSNLRSVAA